MSKGFRWASQSKIREAAEELKAMIRAKYPDAQFRLSRAHDDRDAWNLWTWVDIDDLDEIRDVTRDRELDMLTEERIPISVVPTSGPEPFAETSPSPVRKTG
jgi:hypothetical protein